jgi:CBS-domain-containing membrane protein
VGVFTPPRALELVRRAVDAGLRAGLLLAGLAALLWVTGEPLLFPSLGPSAYLLAVRPDAPSTRPRRVVGGHALGVLAGLLAYHALAPGVAVTGTLAARSAGLAALAAAGVASVSLTTAAMLATDLRHAPACATTLIVSLGLLSTPAEGALLLAAVAALVLTAGLLPPVTDPSDP